MPNIVNNQCGITRTTTPTIRTVYTTIIKKFTKRKRKNRPAESFGRKTRCNHRLK